MVAHRCVVSERGSTGDSLEDGRTSLRRKYRKVIRERPGLGPAALFHLIGNSVFLRLSDVASGLPPYEERQVPPLPGERLYPKEQALVDLVAAERLAGRRVLVYATHTGTRDITRRMEQFLGRHGFKVAVMTADAVPPERPEAWVAKRVEEGVDVLVCHPRLVQTGLGLVDFPTLVWFETDYSVYTMRQASRTSWRIGQTQPVQVVFMAYRNTLQADALKLVAKKLQSSLAVEGELPEDGLATYGDDGDDLMLALARKIVAGEEDADSVESVFAQAQQVATEADALLVDAEWAAPEPIMVEARPDDNWNDAGEPQRTLFS